jgi:hypothetical protein
MERDDTRVATVLRELADLGRRIGEQAGELARLTAERHAGSSQAPPPPTPRKAATNPRERTSRTSGRRPAALKESGSTHSRPTAFPTARSTARPTALPTALPAAATAPAFIARPSPSGLGRCS